MKILIVRFSSFGDIIQALPTVKSLHMRYPRAEIHFLTRRDFSELIGGHPHLSKVILLERRAGWRGLLKLFSELKKENYTHVYDAHNNLRSFLLRVFARTSWGVKSIITRPKNRLKRFLFFQLRRPVFKMPFRGALSFLAPLIRWEVGLRLIPPSHIYLPEMTMDLPDEFVAIAPSAAWATKRWPVEYWKSLVELMPDTTFVILGGPEDTFCGEIAAVAPERVINWAGRSSLLESCYVVKSARLMISGDTGLLHAADQMGVKNIGLIGPTAFGYTSQSQSLVLETQLYCKPCSKDGRTPCFNPVYQKCMRDIEPRAVAELAHSLLIGRRL